MQGRNSQKLLVWSLLGLFLLSSSACVKYKKIVYLQDTQLEEKNTVTYKNTYSLRNYRIRPFDNLSIRVSNFDDNSMEYFNNTDGLNNGGNLNSPLLYVTGYTVNDTGYIFLPLIGGVKVDGKTTLEVKHILDEKLRPQLNYASTTVKLSNFRVTILGEVNRPGSIDIYNEKTTILQALGRAGDLTDYANREKVKIIRETEKGIKTAFFDLTNPELLSSEYFFLLPNDVIYVEPVRAKAFSLNNRILALGLSATSVVLSVVNIIILSNQ